MNIDEIEDVYSAVQWLREHGVQVNNNIIKEGKRETSKSKGHDSRQRVMVNGFLNSEDI